MMNKKSRKCPNCGASVSADMKYCRKCHARLDTGRVEVLGSRPSRRNREDEDALRNLPRPVRPAEEQPEQPVSRGDGFFTPGQAEEPEQYAAKSAVPDSRPGQTAKGGSQPGGPGRRSDRNLWQIIAVLAVILVIIIIAIVLVIKLNKPAEDANIQPSEPFEGVHVIESVTPSPEPSAEPSASPIPTASLPETGDEQASPPPPEEPSPSPSASPNPFNVTGMNDTVYIAGNGVNIRSGPGTDYEVLGNESAGYELQRTGKTDNGWSRVYYKGAEAYVIDTLISTTKPEEKTDFNVTEASGTVTVLSAANLRTGPGQNYSVDSVAQAGTQLTRTGTSGSWTRVQYNGKELFVATGLVSDDSSSGGTSSGGTSSGGTSSGESGTVTGNGVRVRSGPGTGYNVLGYMNSGSTVSILGEESGWYKITYNGQTGYISADYVKKN